MASGADRISELPEGVLHHILSLLPARDAVRTCVLAQSWRSRWQSAPALSFAWSAGWVDAWRTFDSFGRFVDSALRVPHGGLRLDSCDFDLDLVLDSPNFDLDQHGNRWIRSVLELKVRELRFRLLKTRRYQLELGFGVLCSKHLTGLELKGVADPFGMLDFSEIPALASLKLVDCFMSAEMESRSLKNLSIKYCRFNSGGHAWMHFPSLVSLELINNSGRAPLLESMPHLEVGNVRFDDDYTDCCKNGCLDDCEDDSCEGCFYYYCDSGGYYREDFESISLFLHGLADATYLNLSACPDMYVFNRDLKWCPAFNKLKTLMLSKWFVSGDLCALIWFLHHTPLLEKLTLEIPELRKTLMQVEGSYNPLEKSIAPSRLENVEIISKDVDGIGIVLKVLKVLNANGIPLEKIRIQCSGYDFVCTNIHSM